MGLFSAFFSSLLVGLSENGRTAHRNQQSLSDIFEGMGLS